MAENAVLGGNGTIVSAVTAGAGGIISPGSEGVGTVGTLTMTNLTLSGAELLFDFSGITTPGGGFNDLINLQGGILNVTAPISVVPHMLNGFLTNGTYLIISNAASIIGDVTGSFALAGTGATFFTNSGAAPYNVYMVVSNVIGTALSWSGARGNIWNVNTTSNWLDTVSQGLATFNQSDQVTFDDTGSNQTVALVGTLSPVSVTINNSSAHPYAMQGAGKISGPTSFIKAGFGTLTLDAANNYTGPTRVASGTLVVGAPNTLPPGTILNLGQSYTNSTGAGTIDLSFASETVGGLNIAGMDQTTLINTSAALVDDTKITNQIIIGGGQSLTVNGSVDIGDTVLGAALTSISSVRGAGSLIVQGRTAACFNLTEIISPTPPGPPKHSWTCLAWRWQILILAAAARMNIGDLSSAGVW